MADASVSPDQVSEPENTSPLKVSKDDSSPPYELTVKRGFLALLVMYGCQALVGLGFAYGVKFFSGGRDGAGAMDIQLVGMTSVLVAGALVLLWAWADIRRFGSSFLPQIGLKRSVVETSHAAMLILLLLSVTHFLAWVYRSVFLPTVGQGGVIGGGSEMFAHIQESGSVLGMTGFLVLALVVGPVMEEIVFRGYLQSALTRRLPAWAAILITSFLFMVGHGPMVLWPMYFLYSAAWGWLYLRTGSLKMAMAIHVLSNLFYAVVGAMGWEILA